MKNIFLILVGLVAMPTFAASGETLMSDMTELVSG